MADENHVMLANCPLQPMFVAAKVAIEQQTAPINDQKSKSFKFQNLDIATDRNNLRKLFSLIENKPVRFVLSTVNSSCI